MSVPRILIVQTGFLGDAILASGIARAIAHAAPASVGIVVRAAFGDLFERHPGIDRVHRLDKGRKGDMRRLAAELAADAYTIAIIPHRSFRSVSLAWRAGIPRRVGFSQSAAPWLLTDRVRWTLAEHETRRNAQLAARAGWVPDGDRIAPWIAPDPEEIAAVRRDWHDGRPIVVIAPGSVWETKRWGGDRFAAVAARLVAGGRRVLLVGSEGERGICDAVAAAAGLVPSENLCGRIDLRRLAALMAIAERAFTNDSAPLHLAEAVGTPVTAIFGPTIPEFGFGPRGERAVVAQVRELSCRPCSIHGYRACPIGTHSCMTSVSVEQVLAASGYLP